MKRALLIGGTALVALGVAVVALSGNGEATDSAVAESVDTEVVERRDLEEITTLDGTLGFPTGDPVVSRIPGTITDTAESGDVVAEGEVLFTVDGEPVVYLQGTLPAYRDIGADPVLMTITAGTSGVVTSLPDTDDVLGFGMEAFRIDEVPTIVLPGEVPAWRDLDGYYELDRRGEETDEWIGSSGVDVEQLETALVMLGYGVDALVVDDYFSEYTDTVLREWQEDADLDVDGRYDLEDAFFVPSAPVVTDVLAAVGDAVAPGTPLLVIRTEAGDRTILLPDLERGDSGDDVEELQTALITRGYALDEVDGAFGENTEAAVVAFQTDLGIEATGVVGAATWRWLLETEAEAAEAADVVQLQAALVRLGYDVPVDGIVGDETSAAIRAWQETIGAEVDGVVDLGEVVFLPDAVRVTEALLTTGSPVGDGSGVLATSESTSVVLVDLPASDQDLLEVGMAVVVEMPDGEEVEATVTDISGIAVRNDAGEAVFETTIELVDTTVGAELDQAPVDVDVVSDSRTDVLVVPVTALLALAEGGYAVEVQQPDGSFLLVAVEPGLYADGWVEVDSDGLGAGDRVVVP